MPRATAPSRLSLLGLLVLDVLLVVATLRLPSRLEQAPAPRHLSRLPATSAVVAGDRVTFRGPAMPESVVARLIVPPPALALEPYRADPPPPTARVEQLPPHVTITRGSEGIGDYTARVALGDVTLDAHLGTYNPRPRYQVQRRGHIAVFETDNEAHLAELIAVEHAGALHLLDAHGFHVALDPTDLHPLGRRENRLTWLAGALGTGVLGLVLAALLLAHLLALLVERAAQRRDEALDRYASFAASSLLVLAGGAVLVVWSAGAGITLP